MSDNIPGSVANYSCHDGYFIVGDTQLVCDSNGNWTGQVPTCHCKYSVLENDTIIDLFFAQLPDFCQGYNLSLVRRKSRWHYERRGLAIPCHKVYPGEASSTCMHYTAHIASARTLHTDSHTNQSSQDVPSPEQTGSCTEGRRRGL